MAYRCLWTILSHYQPPFLATFSILPLHHDSALLSGNLATRDPYRPWEAKPPGTSPWFTQVFTVRSGPLSFPMVGTLRSWRWVAATASNRSRDRQPPEFGSQPSARRGGPLGEEPTRGRPVGLGDVLMSGRPMLRNLMRCCHWWVDGLVDELIVDELMHLLREANHSMNPTTPVVHQTLCPGWGTQTWYSKKKLSQVGVSHRIHRVHAW